MKQYLTGGEGRGGPGGPSGPGGPGDPGSPGDPGGPGGQVVRMWKIVQYSGRPENAIPLVYQITLMVTKYLFSQIKSPTMLQKNKW